MVRLVRVYPDRTSSIRSHYPVRVQKGAASAAPEIRADLTGELADALGDQDCIGQGLVSEAPAAMLFRECE